MRLSGMELRQVIKDIETFAKSGDVCVETSIWGDELKFVFAKSGLNPHKLTVKYDLGVPELTAKFIYEETKKAIKSHFGVPEISYKIDASLYPYFRRTDLSIEKRRVPTIKDVIFNGPATIVIWADDTKTVVKCQEGDTLDPEKGLAMAISKKALGNKGNFNDRFKKWLPKDKCITEALERGSSDTRYCRDCVYADRSSLFEPCVSCSGTSRKKHYIRATNNGKEN